MKLRPLLLLAGIMAFAGAGLAQGPIEAVRQLELQQKDKVVRLRHLVSDSKLHYDATGALVGKWKPGRWTWNSTVQVTGVELKNGVLRVKAHRLLLNYTRSIHKFQPLFVGQSVEIEIEIPPAEVSNPDLQKAWQKAFLSQTERFPEFVQPYWKPFIDCVIDPTPDICVHYEAESWKPDIYNVKEKNTLQLAPSDVQEVGPGVTAPRIKSMVKPEYTTIAQQAKVTGTVLLEAIVTKEGTLKVIRVIRPLGWGLEESAAEAMSKWKFEPALKNGQAVDVKLGIEVNFNLTK